MAQQLEDEETKEYPVVIVTKNEAETKMRRQNWDAKTIKLILFPAPDRLRITCGDEMLIIR